MSSVDASGLNPASSSKPVTVSPDLIVELDETRIQKALEDAEELKQEGNDHFRGQQWNEALVAYRSALGRLPKRQAQPPPVNEKDSTKTSDLPDEEKVPDPSTSSSQSQPGSSSSEHPPLQLECANTRSVLNANIAACHMKLDEHKEVVAACSEALIDNPSYVKALQRRATANEQLDTWSSLSSAQDDYTKLLTILSPSSSQYIETRRLLNAVKPRVEAAQKRETSEMMDKLKGIGNSILGNFGLSTNNFQLTPNEQGGYSMQFVR